MYKIYNMKKINKLLDVICDLPSRKNLKEKSTFLVSLTNYNIYTSFFLKAVIINIFLIAYLYMI